MKRSVPLLIAMLAGIMLLASTFIPLTETWGETVTIWFDILAVGAFVLGGGNLLKIHLEKISSNRSGWAYSVVTLLAFVITLWVGLVQWGVNPPKLYPTHSWAGNYIEEGSGLFWIYDNVVYPLTATMFAMLAFYVASAAFRAFRAKNIEATLLLFTAFIVLLGRTYAGVFLTDWVPGFMAMITGMTPEHFNTMQLDELTDWIMNAPNKAGNRAITIGIALGVVSYSLKILMGVDRSYLGQD
jgi:hypothetical protein